MNKSMKAISQSRDESTGQFTKPAKSPDEDSLPVHYSRRRDWGQWLDDNFKTILLVIYFIAILAVDIHACHR